MKRLLGIAVFLLAASAARGAECVLLNAVASNTDNPPTTPAPTVCEVSGATKGAVWVNSTSTSSASISFQQSFISADGPWEEIDSTSDPGTAPVQWITFAGTQGWVRLVISGYLSGTLNAKLITSSK